MKWILIAVGLTMACTAGGQSYYFRQMPLDFDGDIQKIGILFQGNDQMIWLGTDQGLYSFDGKNYWKNARPDGTPHEVTAIAEQADGEIWTGFDDGLIIVISVTGNNRVITADSLKGTSISKILFQRDGDVFIATYGKGIWRISNNKLHRLTYESLRHTDDVYDAMLDDKDRIWLATDRGIWIYEKKPKENLRHLGREEGLADEIVTSLLAEKNGDVWIGLYDHGTGRYVVDKDTIIPVMAVEPGDERVVSLVKGQSDEIWIATERNIGKYKINQPGHGIQLPPEMSKRIDDLLFDMTGNLWIASGNKLYMANTQLDHRVPDVTGIQAITALNDKLWLGCESGLYSMNQEGGDLIQHLQQEQLNIISLYADQSGILWIGTFGQGLYIYDPSKSQVRHLTEKENLSNNSILNIDGKSNKLWLATLGGISEVNWNTDPFKDKLTVIDFQEKFNFPAGYVYDVYAGEDDKIWFGTDGKGLYYLEHNQLYSYTHPVALAGQDSFELKTIYSITTDENKNLWISSTKGNILNLDLKGNLLGHLSSAHGSLNSLVTTGKNEIVLVREGAIQIKNPAYGVFSFSSSTGLSSFSPNLNAVCRDNDGSIWIADTDNILHYVPSQTDTARYVHMHLVDISPGTFHQHRSIRLRPDSNFLDLRFTGLWYPDPSRVQYRYMLEGHDQDWIYTHEGRAVYSKLSPGTYIFKVAGSYNDDFSQSRPYQREIIVLPPFYFTWWFILACILIGAFLVRLFLRSRIQQVNKLHQLEKEKTTLQLHAIQAQVNPHFLFNSFNTLSSIIEEDQKSAVAYVDQLSGFFRGVLMHREAELITLEEEILIMRNYTYILEKRYGNNIRIIEKISNLEGYIAPLGIQLLVENAIKHNKVSNEKPLNIHIDIDHDYVVVSNQIQRKIQGMTDSTGFGLSSLLTRYRYLTSAKIEILNDGNTFTVKIPIIHLNT
ncbi:MAG TPA: two-component regulator propeller domain-containing protein [Saprospiraceae bacterium]|nr:two-component regulator propeller domain-containing protein [Saprospiraceae bacterium]